MIYHAVLVLIIVLVWQIARHRWNHANKKYDVGASLFVPGVRREGFSLFPPTDDEMPQDNSYIDTLATPNLIINPVGTNNINVVQHVYT